MGKAQKLKAQRRAAAAERERRRRRRKKRSAIIAGTSVAALVLAFGGMQLVGSDQVGPEQPKNAKASSSPISTKPAEAPMNKKIATFQTSKGTITVELYPDKAPKTVTQITSLISRKFYDGVTFHRVIPGFVVQGGDPTGTGSGDSDLPDIPFEKNDLKHEKGVIAMARSQDKDSANSQFYFTLEEQPSLDGEYVVFGKVTAGMDVIEKISKGDKMTSVTVAP